MAANLTSLQGTIVSKDKTAVEALLGAPVKKSFWTNARPPVGATAAEIAAFEAERLDEIWIYANGRVHFTLAGIAAKVDDNVAKDLPPEQGSPLVA